MTSRTFAASVETYVDINLSSTTAITDSQGMASITATAGTEQGVVQVTATAAGFSADFGSTAINPGPAAVIHVASGNSQTVPVKTAFQPLAVEVYDKYSNEIGNAKVTWAVVPNANGATATLAPSGDPLTENATAGSVPGTYAVIASVNGHSATFTLTNS